jgi:tetratricopeptide (TPR) repeat protein
MTFHQLSRYADALAEFDKAQALDPCRPDTHNARGVTFYCMTRYDDALAEYASATQLKPNYPQARLSAGHIHLLRGAFQRGWQDYEARWQATFRGSTRRFTTPEWRGEQPISGKTILLYSEQGLGDHIQFIRYAPLLAERGATVYVEVLPPLKKLVSTLAGVSAVLSTDEPLPNFDCQCPLLSLPLAFKTDLHTIPADIPYLYADPDRTKAWTARLRNRSGPLVGLAWKGSRFHFDDRNRSIAFRHVVPLLADRNIDFVSIQKELSTEEASLMRDLPNLIHAGQELHDFVETAAVVQCCDLVITADTSVAHLAGALGKPVWILIPHAPEWRWLLEREDSPWYPTARLFRQPKFDDWESVIARVRGELLALVSPSQC